MTEPFRHVSTHVQDVWEVLGDNGEPYASVELIEASTPTQALAIARERLAQSEATRQRLIQRGSTELDVPDMQPPTFTAVRRRTSVSTEVYTTDYGETLAVADLDVQAHA